jgi:hypothetical protein
MQSDQGVARPVDGTATTGGRQEEHSPRREKRMRVNKEIEREREPETAISERCW